MSKQLSVFEMFKIGVGPSSSHTLGPWRAALLFLQYVQKQYALEEVASIQVSLYGSLSLTGKGHATDWAILLGLSGQDPETIAIEQIPIIVQCIKQQQQLLLANRHILQFNPTTDIVFEKKFLPFHANALTFSAKFAKQKYPTLIATYYSIGGGFVFQEGDENEGNKQVTELPFAIKDASDILMHCTTHNKSISDIVLENEKHIHTEKIVIQSLLRLWQVMLDSMYEGCHKEGTLPGGLNVKRRAYDMHKNLIENAVYKTPQEWLNAMRNNKVKFRQILQWVSCFALSVNEVNASFGRIVTAPTNGSAGVIPAVLMYYLVIENHNANDQHIQNFLLVAGEIGILFKTKATISAAMGGCQAEIGVSSAMAAGALCELLGGTAAQVLMAAEIAMEHHLGLTCDPIGGLVQVPCIERNAIGAIKAIHAAELAIASDPKNARVSLDNVISTMWETAKDMNSKYKETSEGGLALTVGLANC